MIYIHLNDRSFEYDIYSLVKAFFPREKIQVLDLEKTKSAGPEDMAVRRIKVKLDPEKKTYAVKYSRWIRKQPKGWDRRRWSEEYPMEEWDRVQAKNMAKWTLYGILESTEEKELPWGTLTGIRPVKLVLRQLRNGRTEGDVRWTMKQFYRVSDEKIALSMEIAKRELTILKKTDRYEGYSLYIGIPFCPSRCLYCSFTSYPQQQWAGKMDAYLDALEQELDFVRDHLSHRKCNTIYIGGGTPTTLSAAQLDRLLTMIETKIPMERLLEFTVEAGRPDSITEEKLRTIYAHGVKRISVNPQTMNQKTLDLIGRKHTVRQTIESYELARKIGFDCINMDLIMGLPGETMEDVVNTMDQIKELAPDNLTVHSLALKRAARLNEEWEKYQDYPMENTQRHIDFVTECARSMGLAPYYLYRQKNMAGNLENTGFAREGAEGIYNILIMEEQQTILGLGAGAASKYVKRGWEQDTVTRSENVKDVTLYMERLPEMLERKREKLEELGWL